MNRPIIIKVLSAFLNILTCLISLSLVLYRQKWFGKGDFSAFIFWTIPFAVALAVSGKTIIYIARSVHFLIRVFLIVLISVILSFSWALCVALFLGPWIGAFSFPLLYLWIAGSIIQLLFLDWRLPTSASKLKISKIILGLLSFPLLLIVVTIFISILSIFSSYLTKPEKERFLIPEGFKGQVFVIFNQKDGRKEKYEDGRRVYCIPNTGVLFTQFKDEEGQIDQEYFYISKNGNRKKLGVLDTRDFNEEGNTEKNLKEPPRDSIAIFNPGTMGSMGNSDDKSSKVFMELLVGTYYDIKGLGDFNIEYIDSLKKEDRKQNGL